MHFLLVPHFQLAHSFTGLLLCQISRVLSLTDRGICGGQAVLHAVQIGPLLFDGGFQVRGSPHRSRDFSYLRAGGP